ncbi:MAG: hypothetical protein KDA21_10385 [Phycisphaerales bacterium]|nr:hypothetical protein [Phycisphaerales bacterium]
MTQLPPHYGTHFNLDQPRKPRRARWPWVLGGVLAVIVLGCLGLFGLLVVIGMSSPETSVYTGNRVPEAYLDILRDVGDLEADETLLFFYSDGFMNIKDGFYYVSDRKVVVYDDDFSPALTSIPFAQIRSVDLSRDTSFMIDSTIFLELDDGRTISFPVSSEEDGDVRFTSAIEDRIP